MNVITKSVQLPDGRTITIETGKVAKQADGAAVLRMGNTVLLATVCAAKDAVPGTDFMPLQVDYREQYSAAGRFPGGFTKREGKASDEEILTSRLVDRALRPLFPSNYHAEVYVQVMLLSADGVDQPDALAGFAASAAMACSDIPFEYYISEVRVARINGEYVVNPTFQQMEEADMDIMVGATKDNIMMVEGEMKEVSEQDLIGALKVAAEAIKPMCELQYELAKEKGTDVKREYDHEINDEELREQIKSELYKPAYDINHQALEKHARQDAFDKVLADFLEKYDAAHTDLSEEDLEEKHAEATRYYDDVMRDAMRRCILDEGLRLDGRATTEIRPIWCEVSPLPMPHGSAIFQRGETMSLSTCTLGTKMDEKLIDGVLEKSYQRFLLHYNFPPFSTGEAKAQRGVGRREIGHGHLAWRGLKGQIPTDFPYTVRLVSQILESNGSSSMATVCAGTLALMDAGVPMKKPVSGIAMGLIKNPGEDKYAILSDILGDEDHLGDMDFKTTGTRDGLTATQMDINDGLNGQINNLRNDLNSKDSELAAKDKQIKDLQNALNECQKTPKYVKPATATNLQPTVLFTVGKSKVERSQMPNIEMIAQYMKNHPDAKVEIKGYASPEGSKELNQKLSEARANAVKNILVKTYKISAKRLQAKGMGATDKLFKQVEFNRVATFNDNNAAE